MKTRANRPPAESGGICLNCYGAQVLYTEHGAIPCAMCAAHKLADDARARVCAPYCIKCALNGTLFDPDDDRACPECRRLMRVLTVFGEAATMPRGETPNCRACNDTGMLHDPHQPCRMCDAYQRQAEHRAYGYVALSRPVPVASISFDYARNRIQVADEDGEVLAVAQPFLVPDHRPESARRFDDEPPSEWQELARYLAVGLVIFAIGCVVTVWGLM